MPDSNSNSTECSDSMYQKHTWSREKVLCLIEDLRQRPVLWKLKHNQNSVGVTKALAELSEKYGVIPEEVNAKLHILKAQFRREVRKLERLEGTNSSMPTLWFGYQKMLFLKDAQSPVVKGKKAMHLENSKNPTSNEAEEIRFEICSNKDSAIEGKVEDFDDDDDDEADYEQISECCVIEEEERTDENEAQVYCEEDITAQLNAINEYFSTRDEFSIYGEFVAEKLRNCGKSKQDIIKAQHEISKILCNLYCNTKDLNFKCKQQKI